MCKLSYKLKSEFHACKTRESNSTCQTQYASSPCDAGQYKLSCSYKDKTIAYADDITISELTPPVLEELTPAVVQLLDNTKMKIKVTLTTF